jgi:hypothetical protein
MRYMIQFQPTLCVPVRNVTFHLTRHKAAYKLASYLGRYLYSLSLNFEINLMSSYQETESCQEKQSCECFHFL